MRKLLDWLYPRYDEVSVFLITLMVVASIGADDSARSILTALFAAGLRTGPIITLLAALLIMAVAISGLLLPFTKRDLRRLSFGMVILHTLILGAANIVWAATDQSDPQWHFINWVFVLYSLSWLVVLRFRPASDLIASRQADVREALYAGPLCILVLLIATHALAIPWIYAYSFAFVGVSTVHQIGLSIRKAELEADER